MRTFLVVFGGMDPRDHLSATVDVVAASYALRGLADGVGADARIGLTDIGSAAAMMRILREGRDARLPLLELEGREAVLAFAASGVDAIVVVGGGEGELALAREAAEVRPDALLVPLESTGGAAAALYDADPDRYPAAYARELSYGRVVRGVMAALDGPRPVLS